MVERNAGLPPDRRIEFRVGVHLGDVIEESDGDLMGDGVNIAARLEGIAKPGAICLSEDAYRRVKSRLDLAVSDLGATQLKNITEPVRVYTLEVGKRRLPRIMEAANRAAELAPQSAMAHLALFYSYWNTCQSERMRVEAERVLAINPNRYWGIGLDLAEACPSLRPCLPAVLVSGGSREELRGPACDHPSSRPLLGTCAIIQSHAARTLRVSPHRVTSGWASYLSLAL
jgi:hypothetical protein